MGTKANPSTEELSAQVEEQAREIARANTTIDTLKARLERYALRESGAVNAEIHAQSEVLSEKQRADALETDNARLRSQLITARENMALTLEIKQQLYTELTVAREEARAARTGDREGG